VTAEIFGSMVTILRRPANSRIVGSECSSRPVAPLSDLAQHLDPAGRAKLGIKEVDDGIGIWLVSFARYDLGSFDLEQKTLQPLDNPFGPRLSPIS
jgi:hypothetical protein